MTSADFSSCNPYRSRAPRVRTYSFPQYPLDLPHGYLVVSHPLDVSMLCYLIRPASPQYPVPVRWNRGLQSRFLQCMPHGKPPCDLLTLRDSQSRESGLPPHVRDLHPLEYYGILHTRCPCRAHTMYIKNRRNSCKIMAFSSYQTLCLTERFVLRNRLLFIY